MGMCDICATPGEGTHLAAGQIREAVFDGGFNPFALGLFPRAVTPGYYEHWKKTVVEHDVGDWNLCSRCFAAIRPYFAGAPAPMGIHEASVPLLPDAPAPPPPVLPQPRIPREEVKEALQQIATGENRGYVPGRDPLVDAMVAPIVQELEKEKQKKKGGDEGGCLVFLLIAAASYGFHLVYKWGFWASLGAGVGASFVVLLIGAGIWDLFSPKKR